MRVNQLLVDLHRLFVLVQFDVCMSQGQVSFVCERHQLGSVFTAHCADHFAVLVLLSQ